MCGGVHYGEVEGLVSVERWSCTWVLPFLATKSAVLSTMSGHCQGEDSARNVLREEWKDTKP